MTTAGGILTDQLQDPIQSDLRVITIHCPS